MFTVYIDDSGTSKTQGVAMAAGVIIPASAIEKLEKDWNRLLASEKNFTDFHSAKCAMANPKTQFANWKPKTIRRVFRQARELTKKHGVRAFSFAIRKCDYDEFVTEELRDTGGENHYTWAIRHLVSAIDRWADLARIPTPIEYIFDWMDEGSQGKREIHTVMAQADSLRPNRYKGHYHFKHRKELPGLQCADLLAWTCYKFATHAYGDNPITELAEKTFWEFENHLNGLWMTAVVQGREELRRWAQVELADPRSQERRRQWFIENE